MYSPYVKAGGIVAFHDIVEHPAASGCEVELFWSELKKEYRWEELIEDRCQGWAGIGIVHL
jgi:hypothetical protein